MSAGEKEQLSERKRFVSCLQLRVHLFTDSKSNLFPFFASLPREWKPVLCQLQLLIDSAAEEEIRAYRRSLKITGLKYPLSVGIFIRLFRFVCNVSHETSLKQSFSML